MGIIIKKPLTQAQKEKLAAKEKPAQDEINAAADALFLYLIEEIKRLKEADET